MSLFAKKCLFSEVNGVVLSAGKPVTGAEVEHFTGGMGQIVPVGQLYGPTTGVGFR
jgi:hypothetical protein